MTYAEVVYMILDELKLSSDDSYFNEYHVLTLADKYRAMILKQRYKDIRKQVPYSNYQEIMFNVKKRTDGTNHFMDLLNAGTNNTSYINNSTLETNYYCSADDDFIINRTETDGNEKIVKRGFPMLINIGNPSVYLDDYNRTMITLTSREHARYVGGNKFMRNILYAFIEPNKGLYVKVPEGFKMKIQPDNGIKEEVEPGTINNPIKYDSVEGTFANNIFTYAADDKFEVDKYYQFPFVDNFTYNGLFKCIEKNTQTETQTVDNEEVEVEVVSFKLQLINKLNNDLQKFIDIQNDIPIKMVGIFEDSVYASEFTAEKNVHPLERTFPMEDSLVNLVIEAVVKELTYPVYRKEDTENNGTDTMPENQAVAPNNRR